MKYIVYLAEQIGKASDFIPVVAHASVRRDGEAPPEWAAHLAYRTHEIDAADDADAFRRLESIASAQNAAALRKVRV